VTSLGLRGGVLKLCHRFASFTCVFQAAHDTESDVHTFADALDAEYSALRGSCVRYEAVALGGL
jgi:hypothetical protein